MEERLLIERGEGTDLIDPRGRRYIDGGSSLGRNVHGHGHPRIDAAVRRQLDRVAGSAMHGLSHATAADLAAQLAEIAPPGLSRVLYAESGSRATEVALGIALQHWQRRGGQHRRRTSFVSLRDGHHGAIGAGPVCGGDPFHGAQGPLPRRSHRVAPGDAEQLERVLDVHQEEVAAVVVEPLVQVAGIRVQPPGYLRRVRELCNRHDTFLICDEAATGFGRTGTMFACEQERVAPDFLCLGDGLTGGYLPLAATLTTERVCAGFLGASVDRRAFLHGQAFTGDPLACAAGLASLEAFREEATLVRLQPKIRVLGELLEPIAAMPEVAEVRGRGLMVGIDLGERDPALRLGHRVALEARRRGAIVRPLGDVIALMPPLTISKADLRRLVEAVGESIDAASTAAGEADRDEPRPATVEPLPAPARAGAGARRAA